MSQVSMASTINHKIEQVKFASIYEFVAGQNNFHLHFCDIEGCCNPYLQRLVLARFAQLRKDAKADLTYKITQFHIAHPEMSALELPDETWKTFFSAYNLMRHLVYTTDKYVVKNGVANTRYLLD